MAAWGRGYCLIPNVQHGTWFGRIAVVPSAYVAVTLHQMSSMVSGLGGSRSRLRGCCPIYKPQPGLGSSRGFRRPRMLP